MQVLFAKIAAPLVLVVAVSGCAGPVSNPGPEEFQVLPAKPLQLPANYSALPEPTPGETNLADATPRADAVAALGGNPAALAARQVPAADTAIVRYASRHGANPQIRAELATADRAFRARRSLLRSLTPKRYLRIYRAQSLNAQKELKRLRAAGVQTPTAPPSGK